MRILTLVMTISMIHAADSEPSTPIPTETPERIIAEGITEGLPEALTIIAECLGDQKKEAAGEIISCIANPDSSAHKIARGSFLCCLKCCKKKQS